MKKTILIFSVFFLFSLLVFLDHFWVVGDAVWGDGKYYYSYVRSLVIDGDLNLKNELQLFSAPIITTQTGLTANKFSIGAAIFWLPFFLIAHLVARSDGYQNTYQLFTGIGAVFLSCLGLYICFRLASKYFSAKIALLSTLSIWLASNLFFYTAVDPISSHSASFFTASAFAYMLDKFFSKSKTTNIIAVGLLVGISGMIRAQDLIFFVPGMGFLFYRLYKKKTIFLSFLKNLFVYGSSVFIGFSPQIIVWLILYGQLKSPYYIHGENFNWYHPHILPVLFSANNGLFFYSPVLIVAIFGYFYFFRKNLPLSLSAASLFVLQTYIVSSWHNWWGGAAYGGRMFISLTPFFIIGLGAFLERLKKNVKYSYPVVILLIILNMTMIVNYLLTH